MENPIQMDDLGIPYLSIVGNHHMNSLHHTAPNLRALHLPSWQAPASLSRVAAVAQQGLSHPGMTKVPVGWEWQQTTRIGMEPIENRD